jgi:tetratricopeptide (TPR) repeat protein
MPLLPQSRSGNNSDSNGSAGGTEGPGGTGGGAGHDIPAAAHRSDHQRNLRTLATGTALALLLDAVTAAVYALAHPGTAAWHAIGGLAVITGTAFAGGGLLGFLFALPRTVDDGIRQTKYLANSNLDQVSDWLTKIIVAIGITQLFRLPEAADALAGRLGPLLADTTTPGTGTLAVGVFAYNSVLGFLAVYLTTRLQLESALDSADRALRTKGNAIAERVTGRAVDGVLTPQEADNVLKEISVLEQAGGHLDSYTYRQLATRLVDLELYDAAVDACLKAARCEPHDPAPLDEAGVIRSKHQQDYARAAFLYRRALGTNPSYTPALYHLACNEARQGNGPSALKKLAVAIALDEPAYTYRARRDAARPEDPFHTLATDPDFLRLTAPATA